MRSMVFVLLVLFEAAWAFGSADDWYPGGTYDPRVPPIEQVLGFDPPARFTTFYETEKLLKTWAEAVPERTRLIEYGEDYEGKKLYMLIVSSPENMGRLDSIREALGTLADPRKLSGPEELETILQETPASFLISTVDTSEASTVEAMQLIAYQLLAGTDDVTERIRRDVVTYIVPVENPSARERYVSWYLAEMSSIPKADPNASEHDPPWGMSSDANHYHLDPNRDGVAMLLRETRAKAALMREWHPEVALDVHEMGLNSTFFFPPYPEPYNQNLPLDLFSKWWDIYAADLREEFDRHGWRYFSGDAFGSPFLGMHTLYTQYLGAIGVLFEQESGNGGLVIERANGSLLTLRDRIQHHFTGAMNMLRVTAERREERHRDYHEFFRSSMDGVPGFPQKRYVFVPGQDANKMSAFIDKLLAHGIEVERATQEFSSQKAHDYFGRGPVAKSFPAGSYMVSLSQPLSRLANAILEKEPYHSQPVFYDVSVWSLPYNYGIDAYWTEDASPVSTEPVTSPPEVHGRLVGERAQVAYAWSYKGNQEARAAFELASEGIRLYVNTRPFVQGGVSFEPASFIAFIQENDADALHQRMARVVDEIPIEVHALSSSHVDDGSDLGSRGLIAIPKPSVAVITRDGVDETAYGSTWFFFDELYQLPFTPLTIDRLADADLSRYNVIFVPDGGLQYGRFGASGRPYSHYFDDDRTSMISRWVENGGTLITVKGATEWAGTEGLARVESLGRTQQTPGAIVRVEVNRPTPLTLGYPEDFYVLSRNTRLFRAEDEGSRIASFVSDGLSIAGYLTEGDAGMIAGTQYLMAERRGDGRVILFGEEPNLRCQWPILHRLLFNAMLLGSAVR